MPSTARSGGTRRDWLPGAEFCIDAVDDRLLRHPPDPEADGLVRRVPGTGQILRLAGGELVEQPGIRPVEQRERLLIRELLRRPGPGTLAHGQDLVQINLAD